MSTTKNANHREPLTESETLRVDLEQTRAHLADTVQQLSERLNVPHRVKETASQAGHRASEVASQAGHRASEVASQAGHRATEVAGQAGQKVKEVPAVLKDLPALSLRHPKVVAAVGGVLALGVGAAAWMSRRK
ncbi:DUF3618 domain-containing protein [Kribbella sp. NPDC026611]|uniref:DUF3618 domain-containing protein n=1 Tax=Kribbella sp. NPDC026611 TaxID=3154911 RepID=UPI00340DB533